MFPKATLFFATTAPIEPNAIFVEVPNSDPIITATDVSKGIIFAFKALKVIAIVAEDD